MTTQQIVITAFIVLGLGLFLPLSHGWRWALILIIIGLGIFTLIGGGLQYVTSLFQ